jgi:hypothetical protein
MEPKVNYTNYRSEFVIIININTIVFMAFFVLNINLITSFYLIYTLPMLILLLINITKYYFCSLAIVFRLPLY